MTWKTPDGKFVQDLPLYSERIEAAWQVVEKMEAEGWKLHLRGILGGWVAEFHHAGQMRAAHGITAPHAICLAALEVRANPL